MDNTSPYNIPITIVMAGTDGPEYKQGGYLHHQPNTIYHAIQFHDHGATITTLAIKCPHCRNYFIANLCKDGCPECKRKEVEA
jgi:hypothetical protein